jgi:hypothetical protein
LIIFEDDLATVIHRNDPQSGAGFFQISCQGTMLA